MRRNSRNRRKPLPLMSVESEGSDTSQGTRSARSQRTQSCGSWRNDRPNNNSKNDISQRNKQFSRFSFKYMESLLEKPLEEVIQKITENKQFFDFIGSKQSSDMTVLIVRLLSFFCDSSFRNSRIETLHKSLTSGFIDHLQSYISSLQIQNTKEKKMNSYYWNDPDSFWNNLMKLFTISINESPHFFVDTLLKVVKISDLSIPNIEKLHGVHICDEMKEKLKSLIARGEEIGDRIQKKKSHQKMKITDNSEEEPPEDFHEISIFPTTQELLQTSKPFLRKNIISGAYKDMNHYLDVQFRLLREDFVGPLRLGIQGYLSGKKLRDIQDIKIHPKVQFLNPITATEDFCVLLKFHFGGKLSHFKFEESRKFMYGSLVCFTNDNFGSILFGRIVDRKIEQLKNGQLVIGFDKVEDLIYNADYIMVECSIYFEPYYHVLKVLKHINEDNFPMKNYIIDVDKNILQPNYANPAVRYKIGTTMKTRDYYIFDERISPIFDDLNESQNSAFLAALARQFSIIQGPPGTGKTYVGLKVARTLLENSSVWCKKSPMLVICFTNHALDQFLEGLIGTTEDIIRIGGQSKNENLKQFNLREHASKMSAAVWRARDNVSSFLWTIENVSDTLNTISRFDCILDFRNFASVVPNYEKSWLANATNKDFLEWLLTESNPIYDESTSVIQQFMNMKVEDAELTDSDESDDEPNEMNEFDEMLASVGSTNRNLLLNLPELRNKISENENQLYMLESKLEENEDTYFEFMALFTKNKKLKVTYNLAMQFRNMKVEDAELTDSDESDDEPNEMNGFDEMLASVGLTNQNLLLNLPELRNQISENENQLYMLESKLEENEHTYFEFMALFTKNEKLKVTYNLAMERLRMAPNKITEGPTVDVRNSKYIPLDERWNLYFYWVHLYRQMLLQKYEEHSVHYRRAYAIYTEMREIENIEVLKSMKVIGMTTTSAARLHSTLQLLHCPIVIVEEAAEVLEAHIVSALTKSCQQLILIGDHQQLRPNTANYHLDKHYNLGISLFERMIRNDVQCFTLNVQHRMRPEISALIKPTIYPNLRDHQSVLRRPLIKGMDKCLYFIHHEFPEVSQQDSTIQGNSKKNIHEAKFLVQLARYLILNGYNSQQITILSAYLGQMFEIQKEKKRINLLRDVRVSVLDNYQGEESDIILLSLVRNNDNTIGFLSLENRVCVALSRARNGLYIMGNMTLLCDKSKLWVKIKETLLSQNAIGPALSLKCQNHNKITQVTTPENFSLVSEGGCDQLCNYSLVCGHKCKMQCHILDKDHENYTCTELCNRSLCDKNAGHVCKRMCGEECGPCHYPKNVILECDHTAVIQCHIDPEDHKCLTEVPVTLPCQHDAIKPCYIETSKYKCQVPCDARLDCGHSCLGKCHVFNDPDHLKYQCPKPCVNYRVGCTNLKDEAHKCSKLCHEECEPCKKLVRKARTVCPHYYDVPCSENVDEIECSKPCKKQLKCGHPCKNSCKDPCTDSCKVKVTKQIPGCNHVLKLPCNVEADRALCGKKCPRVMTCGHVCGGICRENCKPSECQKLVQVAILSKCGHIIKEVPCFVKSLFDNGGVSSIVNLESYCTEPCKTILNCSSENKHPCGGSCGSCYQGRIHKRCAKKCRRILICDHECKGFCRESCKPCSLKCSYKCKHSICRKRCGDQCTICKEQCNRRCRHQQCTKKCGEICSIPPCEEPCENFLKCGHPCIGFCSEPCPPLCRICNKNTVEEMFFGTEDEEDARFILLNDCGHVLEHSGMKQWLDQDDEVIKFKVCPKCKTKIFTTERYSDYIKKAVEEISAAKIKGIGTGEKINNKRLELIEKIGRLSYAYSSNELHLVLTKYKKFLSHRLEKLNAEGRIQNFNLIELNVIEIKYQLMEQVFKIMSMPELNHLSTTSSETVLKQVNLILECLFRETDDITTPEIEDIQREINRLHHMIQILPLLNHLKDAYNMASTKIKKVNDLINTLSKYDEEKDEAVKRELCDLRKKYSSLDITEIEKQQIVKAIGLSKGHWYKCPNGHPYVIGECGGAMQVSRCVECQAPIGGQSHRLLETNGIATFMDGATHSAWSEFQNMNNFQF